eukprot:143029-Pleurochrysis_carterae.AAC.3
MDSRAHLDNDRDWSAGGLGSADGARARGSEVQFAVHCGERCASRVKLFVRGGEDFLAYGTVSDGGSSSALRTGDRVPGGSVASAH